MSSRAKKMVALALNAELQEKIANFKSQNQTNRPKKDEDPEYLPDQMDNSDPSSDGVFSDAENELQKKAENWIAYTELQREENYNESRMIDDKKQIRETGTDVVKSILTDIFDKVEEQITRQMNKMHTTKGNIRKRKLFEQTLAERKKRKTEERAASHGVKLSCGEKCRLKCPSTFSFERQTHINKKFWAMCNIEQRNFLFGCVKRCAKQSKRAVENSRRENSFKYVLKDINGTENYVCKTFLLATLWFHPPGNDRLLKSARDTEPTAVMPKRICVDTILTLLRQAVASMNISFANLGNEECFGCERFNLHSKSSLHTKEDPDIDCNECSLWKKHKEKYVAAREEYERDKEERQPEKLIVSADLQKSGHTFMSADAFHHQVELSLKKARKVLDFDDFKSAVQQSNSSKVNVKEMKIEDFFQWKDYSSKFKLQKVTPKPYLKNMVHLRFKRGENIVHYKNQFAGEFIPLNFLSAKEQKGGIKKPPCFTQHRGIDKERKATLISNLKAIIPQNRMKFWEELVTSETANVEYESD
nr:unnamed protein product [Callosobruchus analis]